MVSAAIPPDSIFASYKQPKSILDLLVHSKFHSSVSDCDKDNLGCKSCNACFLCKHYLIETDTFKSYHCSTEFKINQTITCTSQGVIYLIQDLVCQRSYVGSTIDTMKIRMSNYKSHLKTNHKGCEMAQHFNEVENDIHSLFCSGDANMRSKAMLDKFDSHLSAQLKFILIECVDLSSAGTTKEKRVIIEAREGYWQTQLRTLNRYGGLNKKDERLISNKRLANKFKAGKSSQPQTPIPDNPTQPEPTISPPLAFCPQSIPSPTPPASDPGPTLRRSSRLRNRK